MTTNRVFSGAAHAKSLVNRKMTERILEGRIHSRLKCAFIDVFFVVNSGTIMGSVESVDDSIDIDSVVSVDG